MRIYLVHIHFDTFQSEEAEKRLLNIYFKKLLYYSLAIPLLYGKL